VGRGGGDGGHRVGEQVSTGEGGEGAAGWRPVAINTNTVVVSSPQNAFGINARYLSGAMGESGI